MVSRKAIAKENNEKVSQILTRADDGSVQV